MLSDWQSTAAPLCGHERPPPKKTIVVGVFDPLYVWTWGEPDAACTNRSRESGRCGCSVRLEEDLPDADTTGIAAPRDAMLVEVGESVLYVGKYTCFGLRNLLNP